MPWDEIGSTFSDIWYRVADERPRLSPHANVIHQHYGPTMAYIVEDPASGQYYRMTEAAYLFVGLLDGKRTVDEAWNTCNAQLGDDAPTQRECIQVLSQLQMFGLLLGNSELAADMVLERKAQAKSTAIKKRTGLGVFWSIPLYNPEPMLERHKALISFMFSRLGATVWLAVVGAAIYLVLTNTDRLANDFGEAVSFRPEVISALALIFLVLRAIHELGHAAACKAMGGRSTEIGVIMIAGVLPLPYCDATTAWRFPEIWRRVVVSLGGIFAETFLAAIAAIVWALTDSATHPTATLISYQIMIVSGVTTLVFNLNPLLRYDGYYILSDVVGSPNLAQRSKDFLKFLIERYAFGVKSNRPPRIRDRAEASLLFVYALLATPYRLFIGIAIALIIAEQYGAIGLVLSVIVAFVWLVWPLLKGLGYLVSSPKLIGRRARALAVSALVVGVPIAALLIIPAPNSGYAPAIIQASESASARAGEDGFIARVLVRAGEHVTAGQALVELTNPELEAEAEAARARWERAVRSLNFAMTRTQADEDRARAELAKSSVEMRRLESRLAKLTITAPIDGVVSPGSGSASDLRNIVGRFVQRGTLISLISTPDDLVVRALVPDRSAVRIFRKREESPKVTVRVRGEAGREIAGSIVRTAQLGTREVSIEALTTMAGGSIDIDPSSRDNLRALESHWFVEIRPHAESSLRAQPGLRAKVRFAMEPEPLATQLIRLGRQYLRSRLTS